MPTEAAVDRLAELLPADALEDAVKGLDPDVHHGAGRLADAARGPSDRDGARSISGIPRAAWRRAGTSATAPGARRSAPIWDRSRSARRATATAASSPNSWPRADEGWPAVDGHRQVRPLRAALDQRARPPPPDPTRRPHPAPATPRPVRRADAHRPALDAAPSRRPAPSRPRSSALTRVRALPAAG